MSNANRPLMYSFFLMDTPGHISLGMWRQPDNRAVEYNNLEMWTDVAKLAERHHIDAIFIADNFGMYPPINDSSQIVVERAMQFPISDPAMLISALAQSTKELGIVYTNSVLEQHPFTFARQMTTLDHLTKGRVGWNMVSSFNANGFRSMGYDGFVDHEERYAWLEEYVEVTYKLWEGSWAEGAVLKDAKNSMYADPEKVRKIFHEGERYKVEGPHLAEPSPQRTPVLFQAGSSDTGLNFGARHTEGAFMISGSAEASGKKIAKAKEFARAHGRDADDIHFIEGLTFVVGSTEEEASRKAAELDEWADVKAQMAMSSASAGIDLTQFDPDEPLVNVIDKVQGLRGSIQMCIDNTPKGKIATIADLGRDIANQWRIVGTPESIADQIEEYAKAGVTGINVMNITIPGTFQDFAEQVTPVLKERGLMQQEYGEGTLREKLFPGRGPQLGATHPASTYRERPEYQHIQ